LLSDSGSLNTNGPQIFESCCSSRDKRHFPFPFWAGGNGRELVIMVREIYRKTFGTFFSSGLGFCFLSCLSLSVV